MKPLRYQAALWASSLASCVVAISITENYTMCSWARLRAGVIRDTVYLDGGELWWQKTFVDGTTSDPTSDGNVEGNMYLLNFSDPFTIGSTNLSALFTTKQKAGGAANNIAPNYIDGTLFANNDELYLYGGLPLSTNASTEQTADDVLGYEAYQYGPYRQSWTPGFYQGTLPSGVTRYVTNGAGVTAASENLGFYFSGMRAADWGPIDYNTNFADTPANTLIAVDMSTMRAEKWTNNTLPANIPPRANAELVWIPVSTQGVLVAIGGAYPPEEIWPYGLNTSQTSESQSQSPGFMTSVPIYDIASQTWYMQNTSGTAPGQLTEFCSVVAAANDSSSFSVYIYGGYDGLNSNDGPSDDVWILSIPSFTWIKAYSGTASHGRSAHKCVAPYPDQMFIIGGVHQTQATCVDGIIQVFNLNTLQFQDTYTPSTWSPYAVPSVVTAVIGGTAQGGSTKTAAWSDPNLSNLFQTQYTQQITQYYPYPVNTTTSPSPTPTPVASRSGTKTWVAPVVGTIGGIVGLILVLVIILLFRRRRLLHRHSLDGSSSSGRNNANRIIRWVNGMPANAEPKEDPSVTSTEVDDTNVSSPFTGATGELAGSQRYEMSAAEAPPKSPVELATPYHFEDHAASPRRIDYAYGPAPDLPHSSTSPSNPDGGSSGSRGVPSPFTPAAQPFTPEDVGGGSGVAENVSVPNSSSAPTTPSHSPFLRPADRAAKPSPVIPPVPPLPTSRDGRATHARNTSISSSIDTLSSLPAADGTVTSAEEEQRRSLLLAGLPSPTSGPHSSARAKYPATHGAENEPLVSPETPTAPSSGAWLGRAGKLRNHKAKQSSFQESLDEEDED